jgi:hypothetical protein
MSKGTCHHRRKDPDYSCPLCHRPILSTRTHEHEITPMCRCYDELTEEQIAADYALQFNEAAVFGQQIEMELTT